MLLPSDPGARLELLLAARKQIGRKKILLNAEEMAGAAGMSWRNLKTIIDRDPEFPVKRRGSEGVPWEFEAAKALDRMIATARAVIADRERRKARAASLAGIRSSGSASFPAGSANPPGSGSAAREMLEDARAINALVDAQTKMRIERQKQRELLERSEVESLAWDMMTTMQAETMAISSKLDPAGRWDPSFRREVEDELGNVLVTVRSRLERRIEKWNAAKH